MAGAKAMMIEQLKEKLRNGVAHFVFVKNNGELREAFGTTNAAVAAKYTNGNGCSRESRTASSSQNCHWGTQAWTLPSTQRPLPGQAQHPVPQGSWP